MASFETETKPIKDEEAQYQSVRTGSTATDGVPSLRWYNKTNFVVVLMMLLLITTTLSIVLIALYSTEKSNQNDSNDSNDSDASSISSTTNNPTVSPSAVPTASPTIPKNLIIVISDGMGQSYNAVYRKYKNLTKSPLDEYFVGRFSTTPTNKDGIADSASSATAFAIGAQTHNGFIALDGYGNPKGSILAAAKRQGKGTGLIALKAMTDATPAAFTAHTLYRRFYEHISKQQTMRQIDGKPMVDIMLGGGRKWLEEWGFWDNATMHSEYGWNTVTKDSAQFVANIDSDDDDLPFMGFFGYDLFPYYLDRINGYVKENDAAPYPGLVDMTKKAINLLSKNYDSEGFFLVVEASEVDHCGHANDIVCLLWEMEEMMETMEYAMDWAQNDGDTLVVVFGDHETGGISMGRDGSYVSDGLVNYWDDMMARDGNVSQYWGSFLYDYSIPEPEAVADNMTNWGGYKWFPQAIMASKHTAEWFADHLKTNETFPTLGDLYDGIESDYIGDGLPLTDLEKDYIDALFDRSWEDHKRLIAHLMSARTLTGWTTHRHTGSDVAVYAFGPNKDMFAGHWTNYEIGQLLAQAFGVEDEQNEETQFLEELFLSGELKLCDAADKPSSSSLYVEWENDIDYPVGNLLYPDKCVEEWL